MIYITDPWPSPDWLSSSLSVIGGLMCIEALAPIVVAALHFLKGVA